MLQPKAAFLTLAILLAALGAKAQDNEYNLEENYAIERGATLHLDSDDAEVTMKGTDRDDVHLVVYRRVDVDGWEIKRKGSFSIDVENRGGDLYIREDDSDQINVVMGSIDIDYRITIEAPRNIALDIDGDDDVYEISDFNGDLKFTVDDAEAKFANMNGELFDFNLDDGMIEMDGGQGALELDMDDGSLYVTDGSFRKIRADYDDGEIDITTVLSNDGLYDVDMDDGTVEVNITGGGGEFEIFHDDGNVRADGDFKEISSDEEITVYQLSGGNAQFDIDTDDGDVKLRKR